MNYSKIKSLTRLAQSLKDRSSNTSGNFGDIYYESGQINLQTIYYINKKVFEMEREIDPTRKKPSKSKDDDNVPFVKNLELRSIRGTKIKTLLARQGDNEEEEDEFWKNNKYFGGKASLSSYQSRNERLLQ